MLALASPQGLLISLGTLCTNQGPLHMSEDVMQAAKLLGLS